MDDEIKQMFERQLKIGADFKKADWMGMLASDMGGAEKWWKTGMYVIAIVAITFAFLIFMNGYTLTKA